MSNFWGAVQPIMKSDQTIIRKNLMEQLDFIINILGVEIRTS